MCPGSPSEHIDKDNPFSVYASQMGPTASNHVLPEDTTNTVSENTSKLCLVMSDHTHTNRVQELNIVEVDDIDMSPAVNPMEFNPDGPLMIEVHNGTVLHTNSSNSGLSSETPQPGGINASPDTSESPVYQESSGIGKTLILTIITAPMLLIFLVK